VFQAYRTEVLGTRGLARAQAAEQIGKNLSIALQSRRSLMGEEAIYGARSALVRVNLKGNLEVILERVGADRVAFQRGHTLGLFFTAFVPRVLWPTKPDTSVGQLFNRELHISEFRDVYISATHLGELYWNFGWAGIVLGMPLIGLLLGFIGSRCDLSRQRSISRFLIVIVSVYFLCLRFEGSIALEYVQWVRSVVVIVLLHLLFARRISSPAAAPQERAATMQIAAAPRAPAFPNLLR
jgi:hypothetical protein